MRLTSSVWLTGAGAGPTTGAGDHWLACPLACMTFLVGPARPSGCPAGPEEPRSAVGPASRAGPGRPARLAGPTRSRRAPGGSRGTYPTGASPMVRWLIAGLVALAASPILAKDADDPPSPQEAVKRMKLPLGF